MELSNKFLSNYYIISPKTSLHYLHKIIKIYGLILILFLILFLNSKNLKKIVYIFIILLVYNKQLFLYFQDFKYICITLFVYYLIYLKEITYHSIELKITIIDVFISIIPNYLFRITYIIILYYIILRILLLTTPSEYIFIYLFHLIKNIIQFNSTYTHVFILITSLSYQLLDRLLYNLEMIHLFTIINKNYYKDQSFSMNKKITCSLVNKYVNSIFQNAEKISYILYSRKLQILSFYLHK